AKAGQLRMVTVATNMAGRGTDIILGAPPREGGDHTALLEWVTGVFWVPGTPRLKFDNLKDESLPELRKALTARVSESLDHRVQDWLSKTGLAGLPDAVKQAGAAIARKDLDGKTDQERRKVLDRALKIAGKQGGKSFERFKDEVERFRAAEPLVTIFEAADNVERLFDHGVAGMGGLHVLGTERHEARRIDNQLRGRCGRQGDPGSSQFFLSLEDDLMRIFAPERVSKILESLGMTEGQEISHSWVTSAIARAQKKVEARNFDIRKNLLEYDQVMDEQRKLIYENRQNVLDGVDSRGMILDMVRDAIRDKIDEFCADEFVKSERNYAGFVDWVKARFDSDVKIELKPEQVEGKPADEIEEIVFKLAEALHTRREQEMGAENMRHLERFLLLQKIDEKWKDHLHGMDQLRSGIGLRGYAQQDPKIAYKKEGFELFQQMIGSIQDEVTNLLYKVRLVSPEEEQQLLGRMWRQSQMVGPSKTGGSAAPPSAPPPVSIGMSVGGGGGISFGPPSGPVPIGAQPEGGDSHEGGASRGPSQPATPAAEGAAAAARAMQRQLEMRERAAMAASHTGPGAKS
ncbi:MAG TPA: hypothetical protein VHF22_01665, partial [Planctomycetota bacterium]|nr:hypothetical protein [Planctomycetota bacterium]